MSILLVKSFNVFLSVIIFINPISIVVMPLLVLCGLPSSGKTTLTQRFVDYFRSQYPSIVVEIVDDDGIIGAFRQSIFNDSHKVIFKFNQSLYLFFNAGTRTT